MEAFIPTSEYNQKFDSKIEKPTLFSGLLIQGRSIRSINTAVLSSNVTLYLVPAGKTFFLQNLYMSWIRRAIVAGEQQVYIRILPENRFLAQINVANILGLYGITTQQFNNLKLDTGSYLELVSTGGELLGSGSIQGIEIDTALIPTFI